MARYGFVFNVERCNGCYSCFLACKDEFTGNCHCPTCAATGECVNLKQIKEIQYGSDDKVKVDYMHKICQQCANPACMNKFPNEIYKRADGIVIIDPEKAKGKKEIVDSCPYGAIVWNAEAQLPQKCTMCAHMLDAGEKVTRCSEVCPNEALLFGDLDDPNSEISRYVAAHADELEHLHPEFGTGPVHWYRNIPKPFICGEVIYGDTDACCTGAEVTLTDENGVKKTVKTDFLGDFEFRGLAGNKPFTVSVKAAGYKPAELKARTKASVNLGEIRLEKE